MNARRTLGGILVILALLGSACSSDESDATSNSSSTTSTTSSDDSTSTTGLTSDTAEPVATTAPPDTSTTTTTEVDDSPEPCTTASLQYLYVDVALDDPDGGLNMRAGPSTDTDIVGVFPRSTELVTTGECAEDGDWWEVMSSDGSLTGWVASRYLTSLPVYNPGLGSEIAAPELVGLEAETLDDLAWAIATEYGHDEDSTVEIVGEPELADAIGGEATYETSGLKDDASSGYVVFVRFNFLKGGDNASEVVGYRATEVTLTSQCTRGVTDDGLCV